MLTIGRTLGLVHEWELAIAVFEKAIDLDPENAEAMAWLGEAKQQIGQDGSEELDQALSIDRSSTVVRALRGLYWNRIGEYSKMLVEYQQAALLEPENPAWQVEIGNAYYKNGDLASAFDAYQYATDLTPSESTYWRLLAVFCAENGIHLEDAGLPAAKRAVELSPNDPMTLDALGWVYLSSGRYANAEQTLLDVLKKFPEHLPSHIHLAMTYLAQGNQAAAFNELTFVRDQDTNGSDGLLAKKLLSTYFP
jgi:tetratricopeptide (TPR) repeat protein